MHLESETQKRYQLAKDLPLSLVAEEIPMADQSGNYEFLCSVFGLSGPSGCYPCIFCVAKKSQFQVCGSSREALQARTLESLEKDHNEFIKDSSRLQKAKEFHNAIRPVLLPVPVEDVAIPSLYLDLGIYLWIYEAMLTDLQGLDITLARHLGASGSQADIADSHLFTEAVQFSTRLSQKEKQQQQHQEQINLFQELVTYFLGHADI